MEEPKVKAARIRELFLIHGVNETELSNIQISNFLGLTSEREKDKMRSILKDLTKYGEIKRVRSGLYIYNFNHCPHEAPKRAAIWRFVRKHKSGWTLKECTAMIKCDYAYVLKYIKWLETQGFVEKIGKNEKQAVLYKSTKKADSTPETPFINKTKK